MSSTSDPYREWDAAYVLGSLSSSERHDYEEHLTTCDDCSRAVLEFAAIPGLLSALPTAEAFALLEPDGVGRAAGTGTGTGTGAGVDAGLAPVELLPVLAGRVSRHRRTRRAWSVGALTAAAAVVAGAIILPPTLSAPHSEATSSVAASATLQQVVPNPLSATVAFTRKTWGTQIDMVCTYDHTTETAARYDYGLYVIDAAGKATLVSSWAATPGSTAKTTGSIDTTLGELRRVQVRDESTGTVLLSKTL